MLALALLVATPAGAFAETTCPPDLRFGIYEFNIFDQGGKGVDLDVAAELTRRLGCPITMVDEPRARIWEEVKSGSMAMTGSALVTAERQRFAWFAPYVGLKNYALTRSADARIDSLAAILADPNLLVGAVHAYRHGPGIDHLLDTLRTTDPARLREVQDQGQLFDLLATDRPFVIFAQPNAYGTLLSAKRLRDVRIIDVVPDERAIPTGLALSMNRFTEAEAARWQAVVAEMVRDGTMARILGQYVPPDEVRKLLDF